MSKYKYIILVVLHTNFEKPVIDISLYMLQNMYTKIVLIIVAI